MDAVLAERSGEVREESVRPEQQGQGYRMTWEDAELFLAELERKGLTRGTMGRYRTTMKRLYQVLPEDKTIRAGTLSAWREELLESGYSQSGVNGIIAVCDSFLNFVGHREYQLGDRLAPDGAPQPELARREYLRLLQTAKILEKERVYLLVKVFATMGLFVQELPEVTVENVRMERFPVEHQGVRRMVRVPECLREELLDYAKRQGIASGPIFAGREGKPLHRSRVSALISQLSKDANIPMEKGNPRCLQKLYRNTLAAAEANMSLLVEQAMDRQLEQEQLTAGWNS